MFTDAMREFERGPSFDALADMNRANLRGSQQLQTVLARLSEGYYEPEP
ncbi:MAG TPA: hypothetical protein VI565_02230 [Burkholderiales bacterium]|nr:hypothetical protein [Burkholderiales bacterium]